MNSMKPFICFWEDAYRQILEETLPDMLNNDIMLFDILRNIVLNDTKPFVQNSYNIQDFNYHNEFIRNAITNKNINFKSISWNRIPDISKSNTYNKIKFPKNIKTQNKPISISFVEKDNTRIIQYKPHLVIRKDIIQNAVTDYTDNEDLYTVQKNDFTARLNSTSVLYPVTKKIMTMLTENQQNILNKETFQESVNAIYKKLLTHQQHN